MAGNESATNLGQLCAQPRGLNDQDAGLVRMFGQVQNERFNGHPHLRNRVPTRAGHCLIQHASDSLSDSLQGTGKDVVLISKIEVKSACGTARFSHDPGYSRGVVALLAEQTDGYLQQGCSMR